MSVRNWRYTIPLRVRSLLRRDKVERELSDELQYHLAQKTREYTAAGLTPAEAQRKAKREFGGVELSKENCRDVRRVNFIEDLVQDVRFGVRLLRKSPGFAAVAILTLAAGIGLNTALFSVFNAVALKPLPVRDAGRIVRLERWFASHALGENQYAFSYGEFQHFAPHNRVFSSLVAVSFPFRVAAAAPINSTTPFAAERQMGSPESAVTELVSANYFSELGVTPALGRVFLPEEDRTPGGDAVTVLSYPYWRHISTAIRKFSEKLLNSMTRRSRSSVSRRANSSGRETRR
jgi:hypothetical protein